jgi:arylsulfatase A-like enzyme
MVHRRFTTFAASLAVCAFALQVACTRTERQPPKPASPAATPAGAATPAAPAGPQQADSVVYRFQDRLGEAEITGPDPARALVSVGTRTRAFVNPWGRAPHGRAHYLVELAFPGGSVADYAAAAKWAGDGPDHRGTRGATGLMGGGAGVVTSRAGLFAPPDTTFTWKVPVPPQAYLALEVGVAPGRPGAPVATSVAVDGQAVWARETALAAAGRWVPVEVDLAPYAGRTVTLSFTARGLRQAPTQLSVGPALFADPVMFQRGTFPGPQIVVLSLDAVRADVLGANGSSFGITPNLDRLAADGTSFSQAVIAWSWTRPSVIASLAGCHPGQLHASFGWEVDQGGREAFYRGRPPLITRDLHRAGYHIATIGTAVLFVGYHPLGIDLGWDRADDVRDLEEETAGTARGVIEFLRQHRTRPFFLYVHMDTAHLPYNPPARLAAQVAAGPGAKRYTHPNARNYLAEVAFADEQVGRIRAELERLGMAGRTLFVVTADHGENIDADKYIVYPATDRNTIWGHGSTPYDNVMHVPLVFWQPGRIPAGRRVDTQVRTIDLAPTLDELAGLPPNPRHCGKTMTNLIRGEPEPHRVAVSSSFYSTIVRDGEWKLIQWHGDAAATREVHGDTPKGQMQELYNIAVDPGEHREMSARAPAELRRMRILFAKATAESRKPVPVAPPSAPASAPLFATPSLAPAVASTLPGGGSAPVPPAPTATGTAAPTTTAAAAAEPASPAILYLRVGSDDKRHKLQVKLRSSKPLAVRATRGYVKVRGSKDALAIEAEAAPNGTAPEVAVEIDLDAAVEVDATLDGQDVPAGRLWAGPFSLALLEGKKGRIDRAVWNVLRAKTPPKPDGSGVYLWGTGGRGTAAAAPVAAAGADDSAPVVTPVHGGDVSNILKGWGYIQGGEKSTDKPK